jgi:hypothetical protein
MEYKLCKSIKCIVLQVKKILTSKVKIALRQFMSYFDGCVFHFKCKYKSHVSIYIIEFYMLKKWTICYKIQYITHKSCAHKFKDFALTVTVEKVLYFKCIFPKRFAFQDVFLTNSEFFTLYYINLINAY